MIKKTIYINASNCHQGGGKTLLDAFISGISTKEINYYFFIDKRYHPPINLEGNIIFQKEVTVLISDTPEVVAAKIHELEQDHFPAVIEKLIIKA